MGLIASAGLGIIKRTHPSRGTTSQSAKIRWLELRKVLRGRNRWMCQFLRSCIPVEIAETAVFVGLANSVFLCAGESPLPLRRVTARQRGQRDARVYSQTANVYTAREDFVMHARCRMQMNRAECIPLDLIK